MNTLLLVLKIALLIIALIMGTSYIYAVKSSWLHKTMNEATKPVVGRATAFFARKTRLTLNRFIKAQEREFEKAIREIREDGHKSGHWMWYIFPQIRGIGESVNAHIYSIRDLQEAKEYLENPYLAGNLQEICRALLALPSNDPKFVFGYPDDLKLCSSMTLFRQAAPEASIFGKLLDKFYDGKPCELTLKILSEQEEAASV